KDPHRTARIVIFIVAPLRDAALYLQVVGAFARTLADPDTVLALLAARTPEQVATLAALEATELPNQLTVRDVMTPHAITVGPEWTLGEAARLMVEQASGPCRWWMTAARSSESSPTGNCCGSSSLRSSNAPRPASSGPPRARRCCGARPIHSSFP